MSAHLPVDGGGESSYRGRSDLSRLFNIATIFLAFLALIPATNARTIESRIATTDQETTAYDSCTVLADGTLWLDCMQAIEYRQTIAATPGSKAPGPPKIKHNGSGKQIIGQTLDPRKLSSELPKKNSTQLHDFLNSLKINSTSDFKQHDGGNSSQTLQKRAALKIMVVGDSISHGHEGDYTWRYRMFKWLQASGVSADFVGPYLGTITPNKASPPQAPTQYGTSAAAKSLLDVDANGGYAAGQEAFNSNHFAVWGRQIAQDKTLIKDFVTTYQPDYLLVELGFNDLGWFVSGPAATLASMKTFVDNARAAKPSIKILLANVPYRTAIAGREDLPIITDQYNQLLANAIPTWSTTASPIALVKFRENYSCELAACPAAYDGLHPNSRGEYEIARAFSMTLVSSFKIGTTPLALPSSYPARPISTPTNVQCASSVVGITCTWDAVYGAFGYEVNAMNTILGVWVVGSSYGANAWYQTWTLDGWEFQYQVRTNNGAAGVSAWTTQSISAISHPQVPFPPNNITSNPTATGVDFTWQPSTGLYNNVVEYATITWDQDVDGSYIDVWGCSTSGSTHVDKLVSGHHYIIAMTAWNQNGGSYPAAANAVTVGRGTPGRPTGVRVHSIDATTVMIDWCGDCYSAAYKTWYRNINSGVDYVEDRGSSTDSSHGVAFLFPGVWNYEFCVSAVNGKMESARSECVVAPQTGLTAGGSGACDLSGCVPAPVTVSSGDSSSGSGDGSTSTGAEAVFWDPQPVWQPDPYPNGQVIPAVASVSPVIHDECSIVPNFIVLNPAVGVIADINKDGQFCAIKWKGGIFPNLIEARADEDGVRYVRIRFNDGSEIETGEKIEEMKSTAGDPRYGTVEWDPFVDHITSFLLVPKTWSAGIFRLAVTTSKLCGAVQCSFDAGGYWRDTQYSPHSYYADRGTNGDGLFLGFYGATVGTTIQGMQLSFASAAPNFAYLRDIVFNPGWEELNARAPDNRGLTAVLAIHKASNLRKQGTIDIDVDLSVAVEEQTKVTKTDEAGKEWGGEIGGTVGYEVSGTFGIPQIISSSSKGKVDITGKWVGKNVVKHADSAEDSKLVRTILRYKVKTTLQPGDTVICKCTVMQGSVRLAYTGMIDLKLRNGLNITYPAQGSIQNAQSSEANTYCQDVDDATAFTPEELALGDKFVVTESGTYCPDGTKVGGTGLSDDQVRALCPV